MAQLLEQGTVLVLARQPQGLSMGSGFFISRRHVLSNAHVVGNAGQAFLINKATGGVLQATVRHRSADGGRDFALLELPADAAITPLEFAYFELCEVGLRMTDEAGVRAPNLLEAGDGARSHAT